MYQRPEQPLQSDLQEKVADLFTGINKAEGFSSMAKPDPVQNKANNHALQDT